MTQYDPTRSDIAAPDTPSTEQPADPPRRRMPVMPGASDPTVSVPSWYILTLLGFFMGIMNFTCLGITTFGILTLPAGLIISILALKQSPERSRIGIAAIILNAIPCLIAVVLITLALIGMYSQYIKFH